MCVFSIYAVHPCLFCVVTQKGLKTPNSLQVMNNAFCLSVRSWAARMAADFRVHVPVCVIFITGRPWWMESCVALLGPLVSVGAEAGHLHMMHRVGGWRPGHTLTSVCVCAVLLFHACVHTTLCAFKKTPPPPIFSFSLLQCKNYACSLDFHSNQAASLAMIHFDASCINQGF